MLGGMRCYKSQRLREPFFEGVDFARLLIGILGGGGNLSFFYLDSAMDDIDREAALRSAMTTEHFVLQGAASATTADAASRSSLYMLALSSSLVAIGFTSRSPDIFLPFVAAVLPVNFIVGLITTVRLMDITLETLQYLS